MSGEFCFTNVVTERSKSKCKSVFSHAPRCVGGAREITDICLQMGLQPWVTLPVDHRCRVNTFKEMLLGNYFHK